MKNIFKYFKIFKPAKTWIFMIFFCVAFFIYYNYKTIEGNQNNVICEGLIFKQPISYKDLEKSRNLRPYKNVLDFINNVVKYKRGTTRYFIDDTEQYIKILFKDKSVELFDSITDKIITDQVECSIKKSVKKEDYGFGNLSQDRLAEIVRTSYRNSSIFTRKVVEFKNTAKAEYDEALNEYNKKTECNLESLKYRIGRVRQAANLARTDAVNAKNEANTALKAFEKIIVVTHIENVENLPGLAADTSTRAEETANEAKDLADNIEMFTECKQEIVTN